MPTKRARKTKSESYNNNEVVNINSAASRSPKKRDATLVPKNLKQEDLVVALNDDSKNIVFATGPAGTGKTLLSVTAAIRAFKQGKCQKIVITRPAVSADEDLGFLPGTLLEKMAPWTTPIFDVFEEYYSKPQIQDMLEYGDIEVAPLGYMRGRTFKHCWIVCDEMQNATREQMKMALTRIGYGSKMMVTGDLDQADRGYADNGLKDILARVESKELFNSMAVVQFTQKEVERHLVVQQVLSLYN